MLQPSRVKYRKHHRGRRKGIVSSTSGVVFGEYGLKALEPAWLTARQIEAARIAISRSVQRGGRMWVRVFPDKAATKKPAETRMGGGKAAVDHWVAVVRRGMLLFEVAGVSREQAKEALRLASHKLPIPTKMVVRDPLSTELGGED
jgi:large subunit ribosomal protein L16